MHSDMHEIRIGCIGGVEDGDVIADEHDELDRVGGDLRAIASVWCSRVTEYSTCCALVPHLLVDMTPFLYIGPASASDLCKQQAAVHLNAYDSDSCR